MTDDSEPVGAPAGHLTPATLDDLADALAFALRSQGGKRAHNVDEMMPEIVAKRLVEHLERSGRAVWVRRQEAPAHHRGAPLSLADTSAEMTLLGRLIEWLRRRKPTRDDAARIVRKSSESRRTEIGP